MSQLTEDLRKGLWTEGVVIMCKIENALVYANRPVLALENIFKIRADLKYLRTFGEVGVFRDAFAIRDKVTDNRGKLGIFVGYRYNQPDGTYKSYNLSTRKFSSSRDVIWLNKFYTEVKNTPKEYFALLDVIEDVTSEEI